MLQDAMPHKIIFPSYDKPNYHTSGEFKPDYHTSGELQRSRKQRNTKYGTASLNREIWTLIDTYIMTLKVWGGEPREIEA